MAHVNRKATPTPWSYHGQHDRITGQDTRYFSHRWKVARAAYIRRHPLCIECQDFANVVDHIIPVRAGGEFWSSDNWQPMCSRCHNRKSAHEGAAMYGNSRAK